MAQPIRGQGGHLVFPIDHKTQNLVEDVEILLPIKFRWILLGGFNGEVENVSANSEVRVAIFILVFQIGPKIKLRGGRWDVASCQVSLNSVQRVQWFQRRSRKCEELTTDDGCVFTIVHLSLRHHIKEVRSVLTSNHTQLLVTIGTLENLILTWHVTEILYIMHFYLMTNA